jgi:biotin transport system substrate-specific component
MQQGALATEIYLLKGKKLAGLENIILPIIGVIFLSLVSQISIRLPFTPVPLTGQTFGVLAIGLLFGKKLGIYATGAYILLGTIGLPIFGGGSSGLFFLTPSGGYIIGFFFAVVLCGYLSEKGWSESYVKTLISMLLAESIIYLFGLVHLYSFVKNNVFEFGLYPFIFTDLIKIFLVTLILPNTWKVFNYLKKPHNR